MIIYVLLLVFILLIQLNFILGLKDRLYAASFVADVDQVEALLLEDKELLHSEYPILINGRDSLNRTALIVCGFDPQIDNRIELDNSCLKIAQLLYIAGANLSSIDNNGWNALSTGAVRGFTNLCEYLVTVVGVNPDIHDNEGKTALMVATGHGYFDTSMKLIILGADINLKDNNGMTIIHYALRLASANELLVDETQIFLRELIINKNLNIDLVDQHGRTGLMYAVMNKSIKTILMAISLGANVNIQDNFGITVYEMAKDHEIKIALGGDNDNNNNDNNNDDSNNDEFINKVEKAALAAEQAHAEWLIKDKKLRKKKQKEMIKKRKKKAADRLKYNNNNHKNGGIEWAEL